MPDAPPIKVLLIGAGGHARVCLEALLDDPGHRVVGAVSRDGTGVDGLGVPLLGTDDDLDGVARRSLADLACVAVGDNTARRTLSDRWSGTGRGFASAISRHVALSTSVVIGPGAVLLPGAVVNAATTLGAGVIVNTNASIDHDCTVGDFVHVAPGVAIGGGVRIGSGTLVGIGARVLPGCTIGENVTVGGGAVVVSDIPDGEVVTGVPARPHGS